jgi:hypothetical protein
MCKFQNNTSVSISADRGGGETSRASLNMTNIVNWNKFAFSSSITEQALWAGLTGLDHHGQRPRPGKEAEDGEEEGGAHHSPRRMSRWHGGAVPARPARCHLGMTSPQHRREHHKRRFHRRAHTHLDHRKHAQLATWRGPVRWEDGGDREANIWVRSSHRSPRRGSGHRIGSVEEEEGAEGSVSAMVATAMVVGDGRNGRATAEAIQIARESTGVRERERRLGLGWVGLTDPDPSRLASPSRVGRSGQLAGWASRPGGPNWLLPIGFNPNSKF